MRSPAEWLILGTTIAILFAIGFFVSVWAALIVVAGLVAGLGLVVWFGGSVAPPDNRNHN